MLDTLELAWALRVTMVIVLLVNSAATLLIRSRNKEMNPDLRIFNFQLLSSHQVLLLLDWSIVFMLKYITLMFSLSNFALVIGRSQSRTLQWWLQS